MDRHLDILRNYFGLGGHARRKEYWVFVLVDTIFAFVLDILDGMFGWERAGGEGILTATYGALVFIPWWAAQLQRLYGTGRSAWWLLVLLIPIVGWLVVIILNCQDGIQGSGHFGVDPKQPS